MTELISEDKNRGLAIHQSSNFTPQFAEFLERIVWGSGGVQYAMHNVAETLGRFKNPHLFSLTEEGRLVAVTTINRKSVCLGGETYPAVYSYGIAVAPSKRGLGYGTLIAEQRLRYVLSRIGEKGLFYGYIEASNTNSLKTITKVGSKSIGRYPVLFVSRLRPGDEARLRKLKENRKEELVHLLSQQYDPV